MQSKGRNHYEISKENTYLGYGGNSRLRTAHRVQLRNIIDCFRKQHFEQFDNKRGFRG
jgi:hypothetical protein